MSSSWRYAGASSLGLAHLKRGEALQDALICRRVQVPSVFWGDVLVAIVADGAGSASKGGDGACHVVNTLFDEILIWLENRVLKSELDQAVVLSWFDRVVEDLKRRAEAEGGELSDYATTLLAAVVGQERSVFFQIGDGAIVTGDGLEWSWVFWPQKGEYANTTRFVTDESAREHLEYKSLGMESPDEVALFSDGLEHLLLDFSERTVISPFFEQMLAPVRQSKGIGEDSVLSDWLLKYLDSECITRRTDDDKSLILATRRS